MTDVIRTYLQKMKKPRPRQKTERKKQPETSRQPVGILSRRRESESRRSRHLVGFSTGLAPARHSRATMSANAIARSACWPVLICSPARSAPWLKERDCSREFIEFLKILNAAYQVGKAIELLNHQSAHLSPEKPSPAYQVASRSPSRPNTVDEINLIEGFSSKVAWSVLRYIRAAAKQEPKERIMLVIKDVNRYPVIRTWSERSLTQPNIDRATNCLTNSRRRSNMNQTTK